MPKNITLAPLRPSVPAADGILLRGDLVYPAGAKPPFPLAVLSHQYPATRDSYAPLCADLHGLGIATLAFDLRGHGESIWSSSGVRVAPTPAEPTTQAFGEAFMASAQTLGFSHIADDIVRVAAWGMVQNFIDASRLLLVGSSVGGTGVLLAAPRLSDGLRGILTFGAAGAGAHSTDAMDRIRENCEQLEIPMLLATSTGDPFDGADNVRAWAKGLSHVKAEIVPGSDHGMSIYFDVQARVLAFVRSVLGARGGRAKRAPRKNHK